MLIDNLIKKGAFNLFVGAGISKLPPSYAPTWKEMLLDFLKAMFFLMRGENWPESDNYESDLEELRKFDFRPETFWGLIMRDTSLAFVSEALRIVNLGQPNLNHRVISYLVARGIIKHIVTTNFDEYLDVLLKKDTQRVINSDDLKGAIDGEGISSAKHIFFKPHGTISDKLSLQFTLEHTKSLPTWKSSFLQRCLVDSPLLIAGYSGYDDDLMPCLYDIAASLPDIVLVCHNPSSTSEPIRRLNQLPQTKTIVCDISEEFRLCAEQNKILNGSYPGSSEVSTQEQPPHDHYLQALQQLPIPQIPFLLSLLFELAANTERASSYAWLASGACEDARYAPTINKEQSARILSFLASLKARQGEDRLSDGLMRQAQSIAEPAAPVATSLMNRLHRLFESLQTTSLSESQEKDIETSALGALAMLDIGAIHGKEIEFRACWLMGRLRQRQQRKSEAIEFYQRAGMPPDNLDDIQIACFLLDYGLAELEYSVIDYDNTALTNSIKLLGIAEATAARAADHQTVAKSKMNLAQAYYFCGESKTATSKATEAKESALKTGDEALCSRAQELIAKLRQLSEAADD